LFVGLTIVVMPLPWVAYSLNWIRQRHELLVTRGIVPIGPMSAPSLLWMFGETGHEFVFIDERLGSRI